MSDTDCSIYDASASESSLALAQLAQALAGRYRISLDRADENCWVARCVEAPILITSATSAENAVAGVREKMTLYNRAALLAGRTPPRPISETEGALGAWADEIELVSEAVMRGSNIDAAEAQMIGRIAHSTADRYRVIVEESLDTEGSRYWTAVSAEIPGVVTRGRTIGEAVANLRNELAGVVRTMLLRNEFPPEAMMDRESARRTRAA